jgi:hypothetical protein
MRFHLAHILVQPFHGLLGYAEVIETVRWGLTELGHETSVGVNEIRKDATNIVFGCQMLEERLVAELPAGTIVYHFEQIAGHQNASELKENMRTAAQRLRIWDYSIENLAAWNRIRTGLPVVHVPVGWSPTISRIAKRDEDIDVLFYGMPSANRLGVVAQLSGMWVRVVYACGLYGAPRDELIARSKVVLNLNMYNQHRVFEIARVSYLLANGKAVVSDIHPQSVVEKDVRDAVALVPLNDVAVTCLRLVKDDDERKRLGERGFESMKKRDVRGILRKALSETGIT